MTAGLYHLTIEMGSTFSRAFTYTDSAGAVVDLSAYTARMKIRPTKASATVYVSLTNGAGITLAATAPNITITMTAVATAALTLARQRRWTPQVVPGPSDELSVGDLTGSVVVA